MNLVLSKDDVTHYVYSKYNIRREVEKWLESIKKKIDQSQYILLIGWGLGYHIHALLREFPHKKYFIYEPSSELFSLSMSHIDFSDIINHSNIISMAVGIENISVHNFLDEFTECVSESFVELSIPSYSNIFKDEINLFTSEAIKMTKMKRSNLATYYTHSRNWVSNIISNLEYIAKFPNINFLEDTFNNKPAIIVGSGPSLQYDLEILRELKDKVLIIAAGSSTQALLSAEIEPDIIVTMDGGAANNKAFEHIQTNHIPMIFGSFTYPEILNLDRKKLAYTIMDVDIVTPRLLFKKEQTVLFKSNYSVTGLCIQLAAFFGCSTIIFTGQDLSFPMGKFYAKGVNHVEEEDAERAIKGADLKVENVSGGVNCTNHSMFVTLKDIENLIISYPTIKFINASHHGAKITGTSHIRLEQLKEELLLADSELINVSELFDQVVKNRKPITEYVACEIENNINHLDDLVKDVSKLMEFIKRTKLRQSNRKELLSGLQQISKQWSVISKNQAFQTFVNFGLSSYMNSYQRYISEVSHTKDPNIQFRILDERLGDLAQLILDYIPVVKELLSSSKVN